MARKTIKHDIYNVLDDDGNVLYTLRYPEGSEMYEEAKKARESGETYEVYESSKYDPEAWAPVSSAKADISLDPVRGKVVLTGPSWLTNEIKNSEAFKQTYLENRALNSLLKTYQADPFSAISMKDGTTKTVSEVLADYSQEGDNYFKNYAENIAIRDRLKSKFGVEFDDAQLSIALSGQSKGSASYDKDAAIKIPKDEEFRKYLTWAGATWDPENETMRAEDFFNTVYYIDQDKEMDNIFNMREYIEAYLEDAVAKNAYDRSDDEIVKIREQQLSDEDYKNNLASMLALQTYVTENKPDSKGRYQVANFVRGFGMKFTELASNAGQNITEGLISSFEKQMSFGGLTDTDTLGHSWMAIPLTLTANNAVSFYNATVVGTFSAMLESGQANPVQVFLDFIDEAKELASEQQTTPEAIKASAAIDRMHKEAHEAFTGIESDLEMAAGDPFAVGEFFGQMTYKIVENVVILNPVGKLGGKTVVDLAKALPGISTFVTTLAPRVAPALLNFVGNVATQSVFETVVDDKQLVDDAIASGKLTPEVWGKLKENFLWNAIGEGTPYVGKGLKSAITLTTPGKALDMGITKLANKISMQKTKVNLKFFSWANRIETDSGGGIVPKGAKMSRNQYMTEYYAAKLKAQEAISQVPVFKEMTTEQKQAVKDGIAYIMTGRTFDAAIMDEDVASGVVEDMLKNADELKAGTGQNYEYFKKAMLGRVNLENQLDAVLRGDRAKLAEMNAYAGKAVDDFSSDMAKALEIEKRVQKATGKLTPRQSGGFFTRESAEYMSYSAQRGRYARLTGADGSTAILTGAKLKEAQKYLAHIDARLGELKGLLGKDLANQLDTFRHSASKYYASLQNYMIKHGYVAKEYAERVKKLRGADQGWGENGIEYIPTMRTMGEADVNYNVNKFLDTITEDNVLSGKTIADDLKTYKMGSEDSFMDPAMVVYAHSKMMAQAAQGQDIWRALQGNNIMARAVKDFDVNGVPEYEKNLIQTSADGLKKQMKQALSMNGKDFSAMVKNAVGESTVFKGAVGSRAAAGARSKAGKTLDRHITATFRASLTNGLSDTEMSSIMSYAPKGVEVPNFSINGVKAAGFKEWYDSLPKEVQATLENRLGGQALNITNVKKLFKEFPDTQTAMKRAFLNSKAGSKVWESGEAKLFLRNRAAMEFMNNGNTVAKTHAEKYLKACEKMTNQKFDITDPRTFNADFSADIKELAQNLVHGGEGQEGLIALLKNSEGTAATFNHMVKNLTDSGVVSEEQAEVYCALLLAKDIKSRDIAAILRSTNGKEASLQAKMLKEAGADAIDSGSEQITDTIAGALRSELETMFNESQCLLKEAGVGDLMDLNTYWKTQQKYQEALLRENEAYKYLNVSDQAIMDRHIVRAIGKDGKMNYYVTDPATAFLTNTRPSYTRGAETRVGGAIAFVNDEVNQIFRAGTTGFDRISYINQWFRDTMNAILIGGARPFTDLGLGGSGLAAIASDYVPFGQRLFGKFVTERVSKEVVESTYESTRRGLIEANGDAFVKSIEDNAAKGLTGEAATEAKKRAVVEYQIQRSGYEAMPSGNIREAETYRATGTRGGKKSLQEARQEEFDKARAKRNNEQFAADCGKMKRAIDDLFSENLSKGQWRESYLRKAVYTSQYKNAIEAGNTAAEAHMWATRYAMDATTNFGRPFPIGNRFLQHVPYLGAAINGSASFWRLMEIDPVGVMSRFTTGLILPYTAALTESLSDPENLKNYMNIPEYDKDDKIVLMYHGAKVTIPCPQELSGFLAPFRHMVEKAAGANDNSWTDLLASDALGVFPLDLSGFVELDANDLIAESQETPIWSRITRGTEKAVASLMPPVVKSVYMGLSKRDPYTGREINTSYTTLDDEGNPVIMDSNQSEIAQAMHSLPWFSDLSASACQKILATLMGRSTLSVLDSAVEIFVGAVDNGEYKKLSAGDWFANRLDETGSQLLSPVGASSPVQDQARFEWMRAVNALYAKREALTKDDAFTAAYRTLQSAGASEEKKAGALKTYRERLDVYEKEVLDTAIALKKKYPEAYTPDNQAQIVSLLSLPTGLTYNETAYGQQVRDQAYYDARDAAVATYVKMGFPEDHEGTTLLGRGYYDSNNAYQFKIFTPYEIQFINSGIFGASSEFQAQVDQAMKAANIKSQDMWNVYYSASSKAERKKLMSQWNKSVVPVLAPIIEKYGVEAVLGNSDTRDKVSDYIYVSNPYKKKEYLYELFGGNQ